MNFNIEIERKFLVSSNEFKKLAKGIYYYQGYFESINRGSVRIRIIENRGYLTIKGHVTGATRMEFEYEIPFTDAKELLEKMCIKPFIEKYRYKIPYKGFVWEVDDFLGKNKGLIIAEIELESEDQKFEKPEWIGEEVTSNLKYYNSFLVHRPYCNW